MTQHFVWAAAALALFAAMGMSLASPAHAQSPSGSDPKGALVAAFVDMVFNQKKVEEAFKKYVGPTYTQHNPVVADGIDGAVKGLGGFLGAFPQLRMDIKRVFVDGDYVLVHVHMTMQPGDRGSAIIDIFRLANGKIVEHWDVIQAIPEKPANANTMF